MLIALLIPVGLYTAIVLALFITQRSMVYPTPPGPSVVPPGFEKVALRTADGLTLTGAWRPAEAGRPTILFFHGNGDSLPGAAVATQYFAQNGYGLLLADYRGYAGNPGSPTETGLMQDGRAALAFLRERRVAPDRLVLMGASLGTGVATRMASEQPPAALVLVSPFTSLTDAASARMPWVPVRALLRDRFDSLGMIPRVQAPVLVLHAEDDAVIPVQQGRTLAEAAPKGTFLHFDSAGHQLQFTETGQMAIAEWLAHRGL